MNQLFIINTLIMKTNILIRTYGVATLLITAVTIACCLVLKWQWPLIARAVVPSAVFIFPVIVALHFLFFLKSRIEASRSFYWMMLMASIPLLVIFPADLFEDLLPGKTWFLLLTGIMSSYVAILYNGNSIAQLFNSPSHDSR
jgi:hypothetical protein